MRKSHEKSYAKLTNYVTRKWVRESNTGAYTKVEHLKPENRDKVGLKGWLFASIPPSNIYSILLGVVVYNAGLLDYFNCNLHQMVFYSLSQTTKNLNNRWGTHISSLFRSLIKSFLNVTKSGDLFRGCYSNKKTVNFFQKLWQVILSEYIT